MSIAKAMSPTIRIDDSQAYRIFVGTAADEAFHVTSPLPKKMPISEFFGGGGSDTFNLVAHEAAVQSNVVDEIHADWRLHPNLTNFTVAPDAPGESDTVNVGKDYQRNTSLFGVENLNLPTGFHRLHDGNDIWVRGEQTIYAHGVKNITIDGKAIR